MSLVRIAPGDPGYDQARAVHNGLIDRRPALIAPCLGIADVIDAVTLGRERRLAISVRGGGHNVAGGAVVEGGLMIDLSPMRGVLVDPVRRTVRAQGGVTVGELDQAGALYGLATTSGTQSTTGIAGLTLGGGHGWLMGLHGLAIDNLISAEVVLASGQSVTASEEADTDLFWAIRGGGGGFGVVTSFEFRLHPLKTVLAGPVLHPLEAAPWLLGAYRELAVGHPDELTTQAAFLHSPDGSGAKVCAVAVCHAGNPDAAEADVRALREHGSSVADLVDRVPYPVVNTLLDALFPRGALNYWKSAFLRELSDAAIEAMAESFAAAPNPMCALALEHFHGAVVRVDHGATAYPHREPGFNLLLIAQWTDDRQTEECLAWAHATWEALAPFTRERAYLNYVDAEEGRGEDVHGTNLARLADLKRHYDPDDLFGRNHALRPRLEPAGGRAPSDSQARLPA